MTITSNKSASANIQNSLLKRDEIEKNSEVISMQNTKEQKEEPKTNYYSNFLGTNLDIKV